MAVDRTERLLNLVFCLMAGSRPVSRATIQSTVPGYRSDQAPAAFERMFERDKDDLRGMGIPVQTVTTVDGEVEGYRILPDEYALDPLSFTQDELAVLALAASVWDEALLAPAAVTALRKIEASQGGGASIGASRLRVHLSAQDAGLLPLLQALRERTQVRFDYRALGADQTARRVDPWGVVAHEGRWYLVGWDLDRDGMRVFRLSRIEGAVRVLATAIAHACPADIDVAAIVRGEPVEPMEPARIRVAAGRAALLRRHSTIDLDPFTAGEIEIEDLDGPRLLSAVCGAADDAIVLAPPQLCTDVAAALAKVRERHG